MAIRSFLFTHQPFRVTADLPPSASGCRLKWNETKRGENERCGYTGRVLQNPDPLRIQHMSGLCAGHAEHPGTMNQTGWVWPS